MQPKTQKRFDRFVELYYQPLFRFASRLCGSPATAMVLTQRAFRVAMDRSKELPVPTNVRAWLFTILFNSFLETDLAEARRLSRPSWRCGLEAVR